MGKRSEKKKKNLRKQRRKKAKENRHMKHERVKQIVQNSIKDAHHYEVIIIGAGPAGSSCLKYLLDKGIKTIALEHNGKLRVKPCGGGVPPRLLEEFPFVKDLVVHTSDRMRYIYKDKSMEKDLPIHMVRRAEFDQKLRDMTMGYGNYLWYEHRIRDINLEEKKVKVINTQDQEFTLTYDWLIGAGGISCPVARRIGFKKDMCHLEVGVADGVEEEMDVAKIYWFDDIEGYLWVFPKGKYVNVGFGGKMDVATITERLSEFCQDNGIELREKQKWLIPINVTLDQLPYDKDKNVILVGDSASFVNPMTGEGIYYAMRSGIEAGEIITGDREFEEYPSFIEKLYHLMGLKQVAMKDLDNGFEVLVSDDEISQKVSDFVFIDGPVEDDGIDPLSDQDKLDIFNDVINEFGDDADE